MACTDPNVWNMVIETDAGGESTRGVGLAVALSFDVLCEIRDELKAIREMLQETKDG